MTGLEPPQPPSAPGRWWLLPLILLGLCVWAGLLMAVL